MNLFFRKDPSLSTVFYWLTQIVDFELLLSEFICEWARDRICIRPFPNAVLDQLNAVRDLNEPNGALFVREGSQGTIYFDPGMELGLLIPFLFHEIVHSLDPLLIQASAMRPSPERTKLLIESEYQAYRAQFNLTSKLGERFPEFTVFLKYRYPHLRSLHIALTRDEVATMYTGVF